MPKDVARDAQHAVAKGASRVDSCFASNIQRAQVFAAAHHKRVTAAMAESHRVALLADDRVPHAVAALQSQLLAVVTIPPTQRKPASGVDRAAAADEAALRASLRQLEDLGAQLGAMREKILAAQRALAQQALCLESIAARDAFVTTGDRHALARSSRALAMALPRPPAGARPAEVAATGSGGSMVSGHVVVAPPSVTPQRDDAAPPQLSTSTSPSRREPSPHAPATELCPTEMTSANFEAVATEAGAALNALLAASSTLRQRAETAVARALASAGVAHNALITQRVADIDGDLDEKRRAAVELGQLERRLADARHEWIAASEAAKQLKRPLEQSAERAALRDDTRDAVGAALDGERAALAASRRELKQRCRALGAEVRALEKRTAELRAQIAAINDRVKASGRGFGVESPLGAGAKPTAAAKERIRTFPKLLETRPVYGRTSDPPPAPSAALALLKAATTRVSAAQPAVAQPPQSLLAHAPYASERRQRQMPAAHISDHLFGGVPHPPVAAAVTLSSPSTARGGATSSDVSPRAARSPRVVR